MAAPLFGPGTSQPIVLRKTQCAHRTRWTLGILPRVIRAWCVGWMDETEAAERYRRAVIRPYIFAGRTISLLKSGSLSRCFPFSDVAYLCGAPVKSETGRSRRFFSSNDLILFFLLFRFPFPLCFMHFLWRNLFLLCFDLINIFHFPQFILFVFAFFMFLSLIWESGIHHFIASYWPGVSFWDCLP